MKEALSRMNQCTRAYVKFSDGIGCGPAYKEVSRGYGGPGKHHNKCCRVGYFELSGSTNVSTSSGGNHEWGVICWLNDAGLRAALAHEQKIKAGSWPYHYGSAGRRDKKGVRDDGSE